MLVSEIFASIQGEGVSLGAPSVFVRLAECNLTCRWCDTKYTWDWEAHDRARETAEIAIAEVAAKIATLAGETHGVVVTGGEPLLQQDAIAELAAALPALRFEIETNGTIAPSAALVERVAQWNVSPKLTNSGVKRTARLRAAPLGAFAALATAQFKFVACGPADLDEIAELAATYAIPAARITVMPEGTSPSALRDGALALVDPVRARGYRLGTRLHVLLWGSERGR